MFNNVCIDIPHFALRSLLKPHNPALQREPQKRGPLSYTLGVMLVSKSTLAPDKYNLHLGRT